MAGADRTQNHRIKLDYLQVTSGVGVHSVASLGLDISGEKFEACASGNGPVDAAIKAANTDIIAASVEAYIDCINKFKLD